MQDLSEILKMIVWFLADQISCVHLEELFWKSKIRRGLGVHGVGLRIGQLLF